jgi:outer membrane lipoprotein-sorting protein
MSAHLDKNLDKAYESFKQDHDALRNALMASLPEGATRARRTGLAMRLGRFAGGFTMNSRVTKAAVAAAILITVLLGLHYLGGSVDGTTVAWADVLKNVEAAKTLMYTREFEKGDIREVMVVRVMEPYLCRHDYIEGGGGCDVGIMNTQTGKQINLHPRTKSASISDEEGYAGHQFREYKNLKRDLRDGTEKDLGRIKLNGRDTICFEVTQEDQTTTVWADPNTALPIQIETISDKDGRTHTRMRDIRFDVELDERLFEPPADYCVLDLETQRWTTPFPLTEKHLIEGLAVYPKYLEGRFPTRYMGGRPLTDKVRKKCRTEVERIENWSEEEAHKSSLGCAFIEQLPEGSDCQYVGEDVKLGDASKPVYWWKPPGSSTYRVVYGDLSIRDLAPADLPLIPWLVEQK